MAPTTHTNILSDPVVADRLDFWSARFSRLFRMTRDDEQDLRQDLTLAVLTHAHRYDPTRSAWRTYLNLICRTAARKYVARMMRLRLGEVPFPGDDGDADQPMDCCWRCAQAAPLDAMERIEWRDWLNTALAHVSPEVLRTLALCAEGLTLRDAAQTLGVHRNTVAARLKLLRELLGDESPQKIITRVIVLSEGEATIGEVSTRAHRKGRRHV